MVDTAPVREGKDGGLGSGINSQDDKPAVSRFFSGEKL